MTIYLPFSNANFILLALLLLRLRYRHMNMYDISKRINIFACIFLDVQLHVCLGV